MTFAGTARLVGAVPNERWFAVGDLELYQMRPPLCGYHVIAAERSMWAMRAQAIYPDGRIEPPEPDDPVSTDFYGVAGEGLDIDRSNSVVAVTCEDQTLALLALSSILGGVGNCRQDGAIASA